MKRNLIIALMCSLFLSVTEVSAQVRKKKVVVVKEQKIRYKNTRPKTVVVRSLPGNAVVVRHKKVAYHFHDGRYFRLINGRYMAVVPPRGIRIRTLPANFIRITINSRPYFYSQGIFYVQYKNEYEIVSPPDGAEVDMLPEDAEVVVVDNQEYHEFGGTLFLRVNSNGKVRFRVSGRISS